jgi:hypothetical protein
MKTTKYFLLVTLVAISSAIIPALAQNTATSTASNQSSPIKYEGVYVVIKADTKEETLMGIEARLKKVGVDFKVKEVNFKGGLLTNVTVVVNVPGVYSGTITKGNNQEPLADIIYFYAEGGKGGLSSGEIPGGISDRGRLVVQDNLNGLAILYDHDNMELSGSAHTKWKSR